WSKKLRAAMSAACRRAEQRNAGAMVSAAEPPKGCPAHPFPFPVRRRLMFSKSWSSSWDASGDQEAAALQKGVGGTSPVLPSVPGPVEVVSDARIGRPTASPQAPVAIESATVATCIEKIRGIAALLI